MLLRQNLTILRVIQITWRIDLLMIALCTAAYFLDTMGLPNLQIPAALPTLLGTALAFFIAFSSNQGYSRWWEARIIWGGLVNDSRSWARNILAFTTNGDPQLMKRMVRRHIAFLYALKAALRKDDDKQYTAYLQVGELEQLEGFSNLPNAILDLQARDLQQLSAEEQIDGFRFLALNNLLKDFCDGMGKSERINNTVFPTTYVYFTKLFIWILVVFITMAISESVGPAAIFLGWLIGFVFHTTHINGMSLMNPFEGKAAGIPLNSITRTIEINLLQMLGETHIPPPEKPVNHDEYIL
ncbi:putative membrane protein [Chitinophaga costaii]|uniref:Putative membrane protein n=1 Tax=Chitinophaga costaii TaxID=1335309 RepID=A0A1C4G6N3_9BACT|nr:bestrophin family ion channel [Chitinophaga costaii]PUZ20098.1 hypothetical protein DCM91_19380 [Chitinophaga costaii]SCC63603.1 putative membrane protein [Chitinophaga costaii]